MPHTILKQLFRLPHPMALQSPLSCIIQTAPNLSDTSNLKKFDKENHTRRQSSLYPVTLSPNFLIHSLSEQR